ncbi:MAG: bifunctional 5,10-methylene-tetrahydrofolate dehydrogenase/5,10-methylene-tetrahydrofolate cyclohydrolase [Prevotellaceae bacterium]|jgi:methylenetetrahydrofolate dehydrogenase (NADP+)/methenyltetrahydrofolate cyclohydrolase|nr:bifunctional 5,10-methylene-tetrahydrofolate dehydrogenase/5,10-methylene-tetrahydrofolate cyclohydrolase [Prevotellaceae bacterium]
MVILDGKKISEEIKKEIAGTVKSIIAAGKPVPHLAAILVGSDGASETYVGHKEKDCHEVGFRSTVLRFPDSISQEELLSEIFRLNSDDDVTGLIVQLPLPGHISEKEVIEAINPDKDVDGFHPENVGRMVMGLPAFVSATPDGIIELMRRYGIETAGKNCVILGRSNIVGRPMANLLSQKAYPGDCTVTVCHSKSKDIRGICAGADIIVAALGVPGFLTADMVKEGAVIIDVGITRVKADNRSGFRLVGDVKFDEVSAKASFITPVPGGVGPMTRVALLKNTLKSYELRNHK